MTKQRLPETDEGITGQIETEAYDQMMRRLRDKGWMETKDIIQSGITEGLALEVGPGPGYLGLEWLKNTQGTMLRGIDISDDMISIAKRNAKEYGLEDRVEYVKSDAKEMPFEDNYFDAVFTNGSLHEWAQPEEVINEIARVLKPTGKFCISDLRRDMSFLMKWLMWLSTKPREIRPGLLSSINAAYTLDDAQGLLLRTNLSGWQVRKNPMGIVISGEKPSITPECI